MQWFKKGICNRFPPLKKKKRVILERKKSQKLSLRRAGLVILWLRDTPILHVDPGLGPWSSVPSPGFSLPQGVLPLPCFTLPTLLNS